MAKKRQYKTKKSQDSQPHGAFLQICEPMFCGGQKNHTQGKFQCLKNSVTQLTSNGPIFGNYQLFAEGAFDLSKWLPKLFAGIPA